MAKQFFINLEKLSRERLFARGFPAEPRLRRR
jgi:hypothetical protein